MRNGKPAFILRIPHYALRKTLAALVCLLMAGAAVVSAEEATDAEKATVRKTQEKLHFQLPPDWPIERRGGMVGPIPVEEYLATKFKELDARLQVIQQQVNGLELRVRILEDSAKKPASSLKSSESHPTP